MTATPNEWHKECHAEAWNAVLEHDLSPPPAPSEVQELCVETEQAVIESDEMVRGLWAHLSVAEQVQGRWRVWWAERALRRY